MPPSNTIAQLDYQVSPIILTGGLAAQLADGQLPIIELLGGIDYTDLDNSFGAFNVLPGGTLLQQTIAKYPFANQYVAANATIEEPLTVSVIMDAPMRGDSAWAKKLAIMTNLQGVLKQHNNLGGTYTIYTPAFLYDNMIMTALTDNSRGNNALPQNAWRFDFERPLITFTDIVGAQNALMNKISNSVPTTGALTGLQSGLQTGQSELGGIATGAPGTPTGLLTPNPIGGTITGGAPIVPAGFFSQSVANFPVAPAPGNFPSTGIS